MLEKKNRLYQIFYFETDIQKKKLKDTPRMKFKRKEIL